MKKLFFDDHAYIAEQFLIAEKFTAQSALFASYKINSFKLSLRNEAFCMNREDLQKLLKGTLLNYTHPSLILSYLEFFKTENRN
jgi:hypothetical protein